MRNRKVEAGALAMKTLPVLAAFALVALAPFSSAATSAPPASEMMVSGSDVLAALELLELPDLALVTLDLEMLLGEPAAALAWLQAIGALADDGHTQRGDVAGAPPTFVAAPPQSGTDVETTPQDVAGAEPYPFAVPVSEQYPEIAPVERPEAKAPVAKPQAQTTVPVPVAAAGSVAVAGTAVALAAWFRPAWLRWLIPAPLLTYTREALLESPMRARLLQAVEANPGIHFNNLVHQLNLGRGQAEHHLRALEKGRLITRHVAGGYACYFADPRAARDLKGVVNVLKAEPARRILQYVMDHPGVRPSEVARSEALSPDSTLYHLRQLTQAELVSVIADGERRLLYATPAASRALTALRSPILQEAPVAAA